MSWKFGSSMCWKEDHIAASRNSLRARTVRSSGRRCSLRALPVRERHRTPREVLGMAMECHGMAMQL